MKKDELSPDIEINNENNDIIIEEENDDLINKYEIKDISRNNSFLTEPLFRHKKNNKNIFKRLSFECLFFIFIIIVIIILLVIYIISHLNDEPNFNIYNIDWENFKLNNRDYEIYNFTNGLEVMMIHDKEFDMDGGAIVMNKGTMDNPFEEGISTFATLLLDYVFSSNDQIINNYFGNYDYNINEDFTGFRFNILNNGFKKYLLKFGSILDHDFSKLFDDNIDNIEEIKQIMENKYLNSQYDIDYKENHILAFLVYGLKNETNEEILPEGNKEIMDRYTISDLKNKLIDYLNKLIDPKNIKIVIFSKYKFIISSKYMINAFQYLINKKNNINEEKNNEKNKNPIDQLKFKKSQIIYIKSNSYDTNFIDILYYIDNKNNETFNKLFYREDYFNYITNILSETKEGSLYSLLNQNNTIKSITTDFFVIFKTKVQFSIKIELNSLQNINDIIFITYKYMHKIIKDGTGNNIQMDRYIELRDLFNQSTKNLEKTFDTMQLANDNGEYLFSFYRNKPKYYFYTYWCPWEEKMTYDENVNKIKNETNFYYGQLKPENSVIVIALRDDDINYITCNEESPFRLNCSYFQNKDNIKTSNYYDITYINTTFNSSDFEDFLDINNTANITYVPNNFISINKDIPNINDKKKDDFLIKQNFLNTFYFTKNLNIRIPKVHISINLLHPYLRPLLDDKNKNNCYYFQILEIFSAIKRKLNEVLADAIRAKNIIEFGYNENYLYINILCYEDVAEKIITIVKNITFDTNWNLTDFIDNNEIYKYETFEDFLNFDYDIAEDVGKYYFYDKVKNGLFNKYEFNKDKFENIYKEYCLYSIKENINKLNKFIVNCSIYGYFNDSMPEKIFNIFERKNIEEEIKNIRSLLIEVNNSTHLENFSYWNNEIKQLDEFDKNNSIEIDSNILYELEENTNITYISLTDDSNINDGDIYMKISLLDFMFNNIYNYISEYIIHIDMFTYKYIYFQMMYYNNDYTIENIFNKMLDEAQKAYSQWVDNIGDRFYYLQKNLGLALFKSQSSLKQKALDDLNFRIYNYSTLHLDQIVKEYNNKKKNYDFESIRQFLKNINKNKRFNIYISENKTNENKM